MRNLYDYDYFDKEDEITDEDMMDDLEPDNHTIDLDDPDDFEFDEIDNVESTVKPQTLLKALRDELKVKEVDRGSLTFKKDGETYEGVPMLEINSNKFVFKLEPSGQLKSFLLSDIQVTA